MNTLIFPNLKSNNYPHIYVHGHILFLYFFPLEQQHFFLIYSVLSFHSRGLIFKGSGPMLLFYLKFHYVVQVF